MKLLLGCLAVALLTFSAPWVTHAPFLLVGLT
jgi:hypothetical protein